MRWFDTYNRTPKGDAKPYSDRVKPFNFLGHPMPKPLTVLSEGEVPKRFCLVGPAGERHRFVNHHDPKGPTYTEGVDFTS